MPSSLSAFRSMLSKPVAASAMNFTLVPSSSALPSLTLFVITMSASLILSFISDGLVLSYVINSPSSLNMAVSMSPGFELYMSKKTIFINITSNV